MLRWRGSGGVTIGFWLVLQGIGLRFMGVAREIGREKAETGAVCWSMVIKARLVSSPALRSGSLGFQTKLITFGVRCANPGESCANPSIRGLRPTRFHGKLETLVACARMLPFRDNEGTALTSPFRHQLKNWIERRGGVDFLVPSLRFHRRTQVSDLLALILSSLVPQQTT